MQLTNMSTVGGGAQGKKRGVKVEVEGQREVRDGSEASSVPSRISWKGPPLAVSAMSHLTISSL